MKFKKGDKVRFLNENDHGTVSRVLENGTIMVLNSDDFEVPARAADLILGLPMVPQRSYKPEPEKPAPKPQTTQSKTQPTERKFVDVNHDHSHDGEFQILAAFSLSTSASPKSAISTFILSTIALINWLTTT